MTSAPALHTVRKRRRTPAPGQSPVASHAPQSPGSLTTTPSVSRAHGRVCCCGVDARVSHTSRTRVWMPTLSQGPLAPTHVPQAPQSCTTRPTLLWVHASFCCSVTAAPALQTVRVRLRTPDSSHGHSKPPHAVHALHAATTLPSVATVHALLLVSSLVLPALQTVRVRCWLPVVAQVAPVGWQALYAPQLLTILPSVATLQALDSDFVVLLQTSPAHAQVVQARVCVPVVSQVLDRPPHALQPPQPDLAAHALASHLGPVSPISSLYEFTSDM